MTELLEVNDVARRLNRSAAMIRLYARNGVLRPAVVTPRGARLFRARDVERLLLTVKFADRTKGRARGR